MLVFKPRLAAFYVVLFVTISLLSNKVTIKSQTAHAESGKAKTQVVVK